MSDTEERCHLLAAAPVHAAWPEEIEAPPPEFHLLGSLVWAYRPPSEGPQ